jgi:hypothetical protein
VADDAGFAHYGTGIANAPLGGGFNLWLQDNVYQLWPDVLGMAGLVIHGSLFPVPLLAALLITVTRHDRLWSFFFWWLFLQFAVVPIFVFFPVEPPWMTYEGIVRTNEIHLGAEIEDTNLFAAMPSFHVALPFLLGLWFLREKWPVPGYAMLAYAGLVATEVVFTGEHYVVDAIAAVAMALADAALLSFDYRRALSALTQRTRPDAAPSTTQIPVEYSRVAEREVSG